MIMDIEMMMTDNDDDHGHWDDDRNKDDDGDDEGDVFNTQRRFNLLHKKILIFSCFVLTYNCHPTIPAPLNDDRFFKFIFYFYF